MVYENLQQRFKIVGNVFKCVTKVKYVKQGLHCYIALSHESFAKEVFQEYLFYNVQLKGLYLYCAKQNIVLHFYVYDTIRLNRDPPLMTLARLCSIYSNRIAIVPTMPQVKGLCCTKYISVLHTHSNSIEEHFMRISHQQITETTIEFPFSTTHVFCTYYWCLISLYIVHACQQMIRTYVTMIFILWLFYLHSKYYLLTGVC